MEIAERPSVLKSPVLYLGRVDELFRNLTVAQDSILVGDEVPS